MKAWAWTATRVGVTVSILAWLASDLDGPAAVTALGRFPLSAALLALGLVAVDRVLMYLRWRILIRPFTTLREADLARIFFVSAFLGSFLPAGIGGDVARAYSVSRGGSTSGAAVASVVIDRWLGLLAVGISGCLGLLLVPFDLFAPLLYPMIGLTTLLAVGSGAGLYAERLVERFMPPAMRHSWAGRQLVRLGDALAAYRSHPSSLARVAVLSVAVQGSRIVLAWLIGASLGIPLPFGYYWAFMPLNILVILIPVSLGGFGLPQGAMVWTLGPLGVPATAAFLLSTLFVGAGVIGNLPGAFLFATGRARNEIT